MNAIFACVQVLSRFLPIFALFLGLFENLMMPSLAVAVLSSVNLFSFDLTYGATFQNF